MTGAFSFISRSVAVALFLASAAIGQTIRPGTVSAEFAPFRPLVHLPAGQDQVVIPLSPIGWTPLQFAVDRTVTASRR